jgi:proteasome lid subunit RPN8/RPN11
MDDHLIIDRSHWDEMKREVDKKAPQEACGIIAGNDHMGSIVFPVTNILHSPTRYRMDPEEQLKVFQELDDRDLQLLAIYHSHPKGPQHPSPIDIAEAYYPQAIHIIWYRIGKIWNCRGYKIKENRVQEVPLIIRDME